MCQNPSRKYDVFLRRHFIEFESGTWDRCKNHAITYFKGLVSIFLTVYIIMILNFSLSQKSRSRKVLTWMAKFVCFGCCKKQHQEKWGESNVYLSFCYCFLFWFVRFFNKKKNAEKKHKTQKLKKKTKAKQNKTKNNKNGKEKARKNNWPSNHCGPINSHMTTSETSLSSSSGEKYTNFCTFSTRY